MFSKPKILLSKNLYDRVVGPRGLAIRTEFLDIKTSARKEYVNSWAMLRLFGPIEDSGVVGLDDVKTVFPNNADVTTNFPDLTEGETKNLIDLVHGNSSRMTDTRYTDLVNIVNKHPRFMIPEVHMVFIDYMVHRLGQYMTSKRDTDRLFRKERKFPWVDQWFKFLRNRMRHQTINCKNKTDCKRDSCWFAHANKDISMPSHLNSNKKTVKENTRRLLEEFQEEIYPTLYHDKDIRALHIKRKGDSCDYQYLGNICRWIEGLEMREMAKAPNERRYIKCLDGDILMTPTLTRHSEDRRSVV